MTNYTYITIEEVQRVCKELEITDWTTLKTGTITTEEADIIRDIVGGEAMELPLEQFQHGLEIELEHGIQFPDANVTNNHPVLTGRIVLAHLKEGMDYYLRLECMELEMDLDKAVLGKDSGKCATYRGKLAKSRSKLESAVVRALKQ